LDHPPSQYHYANAGVTGGIMPLCYWASLTSDARIRFDLEVPDSTVDKNLMGGHSIILPAEQHVISPVHTPSLTISSDCVSIVSSQDLLTDTAIPPISSDSVSSQVLLPDVSPPDKPSPSPFTLHCQDIHSLTQSILEKLENMRSEMNGSTTSTSTADITSSSKTTADGDST
jgi:hypothetical protein